MIFSLIPTVRSHTLTDSSRKPVGIALSATVALVLALATSPASSVQFDALQTLAPLPGVSVLAFGPEDPAAGTSDGCIYAAQISGTVHRICFDTNKAVTSNTAVVALGSLSAPGGILGMTFDPQMPYDPVGNPAGEIQLYIAYSPSNTGPFNSFVARAVSTDGGVSYSVDPVFIAGLPRMNESHQINGLAFGPDSCLYIAQGNNSNAGYDSAFAESHLSSAILRACFKDGFGNVDPAFDRVCGSGPAANTQEACDVEVHASGLRNPVDLVWHTNGLLYSTDNDANDGFRENCSPGVPANTFGCACVDIPVNPIGDELNLIEPGKYYGSPNPYLANPSGLQCESGINAGDACNTSADCGGDPCSDLSAFCTESFCDDDVQCLYFGDGVPGPTPLEDPNDLYRAPIAQVNTLLMGLTEFTSPDGQLGSFCSDWDGDLISGGTTGGGAQLQRRFVLSGGGTVATDAGSTALNGSKGLDVLVGPDGTVYSADLASGEVTFLAPFDQPDPFLGNFFDDTSACGTCGNMALETGEQCDGTDDAACPGLCLPDCTCDTGPGAAAIFSLRADEADGAMPYPIPGTGSPWVDLTGNGHDGSLAGFAGDVNSGWQGSGTLADPYRLEYDGSSSQRVTIPAASIPEVNPAGSHTAVVWFQTDPTAGSPPANDDREGILEWVETFSNPYEATSLSYVNGNLELWDCPDGGGWNTLAPLAGDTWYHLAVTKDDLGGGNVAVHAYLNGVEVYENLSSTCLGDQASELMIGAHTAAGPGNYTREMSGSIGQVKLFGSALDASEVLSDYQADLVLYPDQCGNDVAEGAEECDGTDDAACGGNACLASCSCDLGSSPVVEFRADAADGAMPHPIPGASSPWVDLSASANDGALFGFAGDASSGWQGTGTPADPYRLEFDGTDDQRVTIPGGSIAQLNPAGSHTAMLWFQTDPGAGSPPANNDREAVLEWVETFASPFEATSVSYTGGDLEIWDCPDGGSWNSVAALAGNAWYHVAVSKEDLGGGTSEVHVYLDGVEVYSNPASTCLGDQASELVLGAGTSSGAGSYTREMSGAIGQLTIVPAALDLAAVQAAFDTDAALYGKQQCGNGILDASETCDDGNTAPGDGCSPTCTVENGYDCTGEPSSCTPICGDGLTIAPEVCDDGNTAPGDGCSDVCTVEPGWECTGASGGMSTCTPICGDGIVTVSEHCDDGNLTPGDGCSDTCVVELGWLCLGEPSGCTTVCGDGIILGTEQCDDGSTNGSPLSCCSATCQFVPSGTECEDGNNCTRDVCNAMGACLSLCDVGEQCGVSCLSTLVCQDVGGSCTCALP